MRWQILSAEMDINVLDYSLYGVDEMLEAMHQVCSRIDFLQPHTSPYCTAVPAATDSHIVTLSLVLVTYHSHSRSHRSHINSVHLKVEIRAQAAAISLSFLFIERCSAGADDLDAVRRKLISESEVHHAE